MKTLRPMILIGLFAMFLLLACAPNGGIEVGNPDLKQKKVRLEPEGSEIVYLLEFEDATQVSVSRILGEAVETVSVPYSEENNQIALSANFSDGSGIEVQMNVTLLGNLVNVQLKVDGTPTPVDAQTVDVGDSSNVSLEDGGAADSAPSTEPVSQNPASELTQALCESIVACNAQISPEDCELEVAQVPDLSREFGGDGESLQSSANRIDLGELAWDAEAFAACLEGIAGVTCDTVSRYFQEGKPVNYPKVKRLVPKPDCSSVF